jgi:hypothetical protein
MRAKEKYTNPLERKKAKKPLIAVQRLGTTSKRHGDAMKESRETRAVWLKLRVTKTEREAIAAKAAA